MSERDDNRRREPMTAAHLRDLAEAGAAGMVVVPAGVPWDLRPAGWTHALEEYRPLAGRRFLARLESRASGLTYAVDEGSCTCDHWTREVQRSPGSVCKHQRYFGALSAPEMDERRERAGATMRQLSALT